MKKLIIGAAFSTIATLAAMGAAQAADCLRNYTFKNVTNSEIYYRVESRTRANATWHSPTSKKHNYVGAGETVRGLLQYKVVGCGVKRKVRIIISCYNEQKEDYDQRRVINVAQGTMHKVYDLKTDLYCQR